MTPFLTSLLIVFLAEMGDKTQLLAMAFAARLRWQTVLLGIFVATAANHFLAVVAGTYLSNVVPIFYVRIAASLSFILFGFWTIRGDSLTDEDKRYNFTPFWTVAAAFFLAEMGDKTQLASAALAAEMNNIIPVWIGTTTGMMIADAIGIIIGIVMHKRIPEKQVKWFAALVFIAFGLWGLYKALAP
jgi:putative Ca2+/H+ antiporter (TMEM165/GDT1 family)